MKTILRGLLIALLTASVLLASFACGEIPPATDSQPDGTPSSAEPASSLPGGSSAAEPDASGEPSADPSSSNPGTTSAETPSPSAAPVEYNVRPAEWASVEWENYSSLYFTLTIPKGWEVQWKGDAKQLYWNVTKPGTLLGMSNLDHRYAAKSYAYAQMGGADLYLPNATVQEFFEAVFASGTEYFTVKNSCVPSNYAEIQSVNPSKTIRDYRSLYAVFRENGVEGEGLYSAIVVNSPDVIVGGFNYGLWEIDAIVTEWAPLGEFVNWYPVLHKIAQSFAYTDYYIQQWGQVINGQGSGSGSDSDDPILQAFEERSTQDTILQEKRSDMIGEYERVVDNETGEIYRAYNGFLDDIGNEQTRYSPITDQQYAEGFVGWIDK
ncbi:MAG: hypothetical protein ILO68_07760 [Clostridia bacterium]|nr:hypothetical protein [Clostridia bacterium]